MKILVTGFNGKVGFEVAAKLRIAKLPMVCSVRNTEKAKRQYGDQYSFVALDFANPDTFETALAGVDQIFLMYPPGENLQFAQFIEVAKEMGVQHIVYLSLKDVQFMPFVHHYKNEKLIKKSGIPYTFLRAGYFMQNLNDFLYEEIKKNKRIFVPAGKGKTSFVDARDIAEIAVLAMADKADHKNKSYVITGGEALDFCEVAEIMTDVLGTPVQYINPTVKDFKEYMIANGREAGYINVVVGVHFPTKLGMAKGIKHDFETLTHKKPTTLKKYIEDYKENWQ